MAMKSTSSRRKPRRRGPSKKWLKDRALWSKAVIMREYDREISLETAIEWARTKTKRELLTILWNGERAQDYANRQPCPKGHKPDDPACDLMCQITLIDPMMEAAERKVAPWTLHEWHLDELKPVRRRWPASRAVLQDMLTGVSTVAPEQPKVEYNAMVRAYRNMYGLVPAERQCAREFLGLSNKQENLKALMEIIRDQGLENEVNWQAFAKRYRDLDAQFAVPKVPWWKRWWRGSALRLFPRGERS